MRVSAASKVVHKAIRKAGAKTVKKTAGKAASRVIEGSFQSLWNSLNPYDDVAKSIRRPRGLRVVATRLKVAFPGGKALATHYRLQRGPNAFSIAVPNNLSPAERKWSLSAIARKYRLLSRKDRPLLKGILLDPGRNPADAFWAKKYKMPNFKSAATAGDGWMTFYRGGRNGHFEIDWAFLHEQGHNIFHGRKLEAAWKRVMKADGKALTHYATSAPTEDFAETFQALLIARRKGSQFVNWLKRVVPNRYQLLARTR